MWLYSSLVLLGFSDTGYPWMRLSLKTWYAMIFYEFLITVKEYLYPLFCSLKKKEKKNVSFILSHHLQLAMWSWKIQVNVCICIWNFSFAFSRMSIHAMLWTSEWRNMEIGGWWILIADKGWWRLIWVYHGNIHNSEARWLSEMSYPKRWWLVVWESVWLAHSDTLHPFIHNNKVIISPDIEEFEYTREKSTANSAILDRKKLQQV